MFKLFRSSKGFTLVELMIVLIMLGFGAFALINLSQSAWRSFSKSEERYIKQEAVKYVAENLQKNGSIAAATRVELYTDTAVLTTDDGTGKSYNYLYVDPATGLLTAKAANGDVAALTDVPMYVTFDVIPYNDGKKDDFTSSRAVICHISAVENEYDGLSVPSSDDIFYTLDVSYHFANMIEMGSMYVNYRAVGANEREQIKTGSIATQSEDAVVLKFISDVDFSVAEMLNEGNFNTYCFVATASYGADSGEVGLLCDFRDSVLMQSAPGRAFVKAYYTVSPPIAKVIAKSEPLKAAVRLALKPLVIVATFALDHDLLAANMAYIIILMITAAAAVTVIVYCRRKRRKE